MSARYIEFHVLISIPIRIQFIHERKHFNEMHVIIMFWLNKTPCPGVDALCTQPHTVFYVLRVWKISEAMNINKRVACNVCSCPTNPWENCQCRLSIANNYYSDDIDSVDSLPLLLRDPLLTCKFVRIATHENMR